MDDLNTKEELCELRLDEITELQTRKGIRPQVVEDLMDLIERDVDVDPILVIRDLKAVPPRCWIADGHHRRAAHRQLGRSVIWCRVRDGTKWDAIQAGLEANRQHVGERLSLADKQNAIRVVLKERPRLANGAIAALVNCDPKTVAKYRGEMESGREIPTCDAREGLDGKLYPVTQCTTTSEVSGESAPARDGVGQVEPACLSGTIADTLSVAESPSYAGNSAENGGAGSNKAPTERQRRIEHLFVPEVRELIMGSKVSGKPEDFMRLSEYSEYEQRGILEDVISGRCRTLGDALLGGEYDDEIDEDDVDVNFDSEPPEEIPGPTTSVSQRMDSNARTMSQEPNYPRPSGARLGGEENVPAQTPTPTHNATEPNNRPKDDANSESLPAASPGSTRGDTEQSDITDRADKVSVEDVGVAERRGVVGSLDTPKQDPTIAAKSATKLIREAQDALGQLAKKIDWLVEGTNNRPAYQETRRDLERIGKRLETWQSLPIDVTAA